MSDHIYISIGPFCWGSGKTSEEAFKNAKMNFPYSYLKGGAEVKFSTALYPKDSEISGFNGDIQWEKHEGCTVPECRASEPKGERDIKEFKLQKSKRNSHSGRLVPLK